MVFGLLRDCKAGENRVLCTPLEIRAIAAQGHRVLAERGCGLGAGFDDAQYAEAGAELVPDAAAIFAAADIVGKVKEFEPSEWPLIRPGQILVGCIHPAGHPEELEALLRSGCIAFSAEDSHRFGSPNCEAAGKQGALFGLESLLSIHGGKGKYVGGFAGAPGIHALILGGGMVGRGALSVLHALGARVTLMDVNMGVLRSLSDAYGSRIDTMLCSKEAIASLLPTVDLVINAVKWPKERRDFLIDREMLKLMEKGSALVDISNDEPGAIESSRATTHDAPRYIENGVVHFCVSNIPGAVAQSASAAYAAQMLPFLQSLLNRGVKATCIADGYYRRSLTCYKGILTHEESSAIQNRPWMRPEDALGVAGEALDPAPPATTTRSAHFIQP